MPVAAAVNGAEPVLAGLLPAGRYAVVRHTGPFSQLAGATRDLLDWAAARGLAWDRTESPAGERWGCRLEVYLTNPAVEPDPGKWETELAFRLARLTAGQAPSPLPAPRSARPVPPKCRWLVG